MEPRLRVYHARASEDTSKTRLIGGLFAVIESNHGVLTTLARAPSVQGFRVLGRFNVEPCTSDPHHPTTTWFSLSHSAVPKKKTPGLET
jgi:hypothetical protein